MRYDGQFGVPSEALHRKTAKRKRKSAARQARKASKDDATASPKEEEEEGEEEGKRLLMKLLSPKRCTHPSTRGESREQKAPNSRR